MPKTITSKVRRNFIRYMFCAFVFILPSGASFSEGGFDVRIANRGEIPLYVAWVNKNSRFDLQVSSIKGWYKIDPSTIWEPRIIHNDAFSAEYRLTFAIKDSAGNFGIAPYVPKQTKFVERISEKYPVRGDGKRFHYRSWFYKNHDTKAQGRVVVPFMWKVASPDIFSNYDVTLRFEPKKTDKIILLLNKYRPKKPKKPVAKKAPVPNSFGVRPRRIPAPQDPLPNAKADGSPFDKYFEKKFGGQTQFLPENEGARSAIDACSVGLSTATKGIMGGCGSVATRMTAYCNAGVSKNTEICTHWADRRSAVVQALK